MGAQSLPAYGHIESETGVGGPTRPGTESDALNVTGGRASLPRWAKWISRIAIVLYLFVLWCGGGGGGGGARAAARGC